MIERDYFSHTIPGYGKVWDKLHADRLLLQGRAARTSAGTTTPTTSRPPRSTRCSWTRPATAPTSWARPGTSSAIGAYKGPTGKKMWTVLFADKCGTTRPEADRQADRRSRRRSRPPRPTARPTPTPRRRRQARRRRRSRPRSRRDADAPTPSRPDRRRRSSLDDRRPGADRRRLDRPTTDPPSQDPDRRHRPGDGAVGMRVVDDGRDRRSARVDRRRRHRVLLRRLTRWPSRRAPPPRRRHVRPADGSPADRPPAAATVADAGHPRGTRPDQVLPARPDRPSRRCAASR